MGCIVVVFWLPFGSFLAPFRLPLVHFGLPQVPFWLTFGALWLTVGALVLVFAHPGARVLHFRDLLMSIQIFACIFEQAD